MAYFKQAILLALVLMSLILLAKSAPSQKQLIKSQWEVLEMGIDTTWEKCLPTYLKYVSIFVCE